MLLKKSTINKIKSKEVELPTAVSFDLPEKVLQFGTGVLLRGLPDYFFDKANKQGLLNGRILVVKSTSTGRTDAFQQQDNLYTLCTKGIEKGKEVVQYTINNAISRVLSAHEDWPTILCAAHNTGLKIIVSNTTEVGITLSDDKISDNPPPSFPGKLLAFLHERFTYTDGDLDAGFVILPTELISDNATKLKEIVLQLSRQNNLGTDFENWLTSANDFCNTLVDRIVPGSLPEEEKLKTEALLGYQDDLMIMAEPFRLWAIETDSARVKNILNFAQVDRGIVLTPSIAKFKEIKLRLLNGTHTLSCAIALLSGFHTVKEAMTDQVFQGFVSDLMEKEIGPAITGQDIKKEEANDFSNNVIDRFSNPFLDHKWESIALNYTSKMNMRNIALLEQWYRKNSTVPTHFALGFAAYIKLMDTEVSNGRHVRLIGAQQVALQDEFAPTLKQYWENTETVVHHILRDQSLWGTDLTQYTGFEACVTKYLNEIEQYGALATIENIGIGCQIES